MNTKILVVDDEPDIRLLIKDILEDEGYSVDVAEHAQQAGERKHAFAPDLVLLDIWMPEMDGVSLLKHWHENNELNCPVVMMSGHGTVETAVEATRYGAYDFVEKPLSTAKLLRTVKSALESRTETSAEEQRLASEQPVGHSQQMQQLRQTMQQLAQHLQPVFLIGEAGSGVSLWANYLFSSMDSALKVSAFRATNLNLHLPLAEHIFIREIADLGMEDQHAMLSWLKRPLNPTSKGRVVVASQHPFDVLRKRDDVLPELAEYFRQAIAIPSLNERIEDMPELVEYYVTWFSDKEGLPYRHFGVAAQNMLRNHSWPGGLTELKTVLRKILGNSSEDNVSLEEITQAFASAPVVNVPLHVLHLDIDLDLDLREARELFEREYLLKQLELCRYNVSELARKIGQERTNLYRKLKSLGLQSKK